MVHSSWYEMSMVIAFSISGRIDVGTYLRNGICLKRLNHASEVLFAARKSAVLGLVPLRIPLTIPGRASSGTPTIGSVQTALICVCKSSTDALNMSAKSSLSCLPSEATCSLMNRMASSTKAPAISLYFSNLAHVISRRSFWLIPKTIFSGRMGVRCP